MWVQVAWELELVGRKMKHLARLDYAHSLQLQCEKALLKPGVDESGCVGGAGGGGVKVTLKDGEEIDCDAVLCTAPLGVLQSGLITWFPALPQWKAGAIGRVGNGLINKVFLKFEAPFWDTEVDFFGRTSDDAKKRGAFFLVWSMVRSSGDNILVGITAGEAAYDLEDKTDEQQVRMLMSALGEIFGDVPAPTHTLVTRWGSDDKSLGAYSYMQVGGQGGSDYDVLAAPVGDAIFFGGEGTCREHPATAAGAFLTGLREAGRIDKMLSDE